MSETECDNFTFTIKYENEYSVWADFYVKYQGRYYDYKEYRVTNSGLQVCNSSDLSIKERWRDLIAKEKEQIASQHCNASIDGFYTSYILYKNFTVFFQLTQQYFTRQDYGVILRGFAVCSRKLTLSCNDDLVKIKYSERFIVLQNFSLFYNNKMYDYREYRFSNDTVEICASNDPRILTIWKTRNSWEKSKDLYKCHVTNDYHILNPLMFYAVNNQFTVYLADNSQYLTRSHYAVINGKPHFCAENLTHQSTDYTQEDLLMCNDSIINIKYDEEYKVWNNFSIFYKNVFYDYTEYRVLNDGIKICNSTNTSIRNFWKLRNKWVKEKMHLNSCKKPIRRLHTLYHWGYIVLKDFRVSILNTRQVIRRYDYGVSEGILTICFEKLNKKSRDLIDKIFLACAFLLSCICLFLLFVVYGILPELRTLPGLNLMSLSFSFLLWQTYAIVAYSLAPRKVKMNSVLCAWKDVMSYFTQFCTLTNSAVNVYLLSKTFCSNTLARSHEKKWKTFLKYSFFSWGIPVIVMIVNIVLVKVDVVRYSVDIYGDCVTEQVVPLDECYTFLFLFLFLYTIGIFFTSAYRLRQKLKDGNSIAQASNNATNRNSFIVFVKLFSTTAITFWLPRKISQYVEVNDHVKTALTTISFLVGLYIGVAFVFTKKNYKLLKKKYQLAKNKPSNENVTVRTSTGGILEEG